MFAKRKLVKAITKIYQKIYQQYLSTIKKQKKQIVWLLRSIFVIRSRRSSADAGFVLPTVAMVTVVVVLLTTAILFRSFDRSKNASNVRVNQAVMSAVAPTIDRARAKINKLFSDNRLPRATPTDKALEDILKNNINEYSFGDESPLSLSYTFANNTTQTLNTAWRFPVDTDNNGKFDSYNLYGIYFKNPPQSGNQYTRARSPLEARTTPMAAGGLGDGCEDVFGTSATLVGVNGWFKLGSKLKKAFFVYTATVPITSTTAISSLATNVQSNYEVYKGNKGFSALEYQQDRVQLPQINNAVVYEDDLELTPGPDFKMNGGIFTNSNFLTASGSANIKLYQVSSPASCFYESENGKIIVSGNTGAGKFTDTSDLSKATAVDLFPGKGVAPSSSPNITAHKSVTDAPADIAYNNLAYAQRLNRLVEAQIAADSTGSTDPSEVQQGIQGLKASLGLSSYTAAEEAQFRSQQLQLYFKKRTRRVPFKEVAFGGDALGNYATGKTSPLQSSGETLRPIDAWSYPTDTTDGKTGTNYTKLTLKTSGTKLLPSATEPNLLQTQGSEQYLGDRVFIGNNLPQIWWDKNQSQFVGPNPQDTQTLSNIEWDKWDSNKPNTKTRTRLSRVQTLADLGSTDRDGLWELAAAQIPQNPQDPVGGLRVVTGAGIYLRQNDTPATSDFSTAESVIWSDTKPVTQAGAPKDANNKPITTIKPYWMYDYFYTTNGTSYSPIPVTFKWSQISDLTKTPYLKMRATAVYHYKSTSYNQQYPKPIACVSSFYVPTNSTTAKNLSTLPWNNATGGLSNNGIVYGPPTKSVSDYLAVLTYQSNLTYPNGRSIDDGLLTKALAKTATNRTISEQSTIDAAICALQILDGSIGTPTNAVIPHGAIQETAFLDARQVQTVHATPSTTNYDLPLKDRQPLEIRTTLLDLDLLRKTKIGGTTPAQEYLIPNSGIIYATRDDALRDSSSTKTDSTANKLESPVDYILDHRRRPNAIMLVNGSKLWREQNYRDAEKGFILATNLPVYVKGNFNLHTQEEFTDTLKDDWSNFYTRTKATSNPNFACRPQDPRLSNCTTGDEWRSAAVLADAITLLSNNFRLGFRDEGDYDWNNSYTGATPVPSGFSSVNNYVTQARWRDPTTGLAKDLDSATSGFQGSSYLNNFVTPILLQMPPGPYLTEVCTATNQADCADPSKVKTAWTIQTACGNGGGNTYWNNQIIGKNGNPQNSRLKTGYIFDDPAEFDTAKPQCFPAGAPRRIAFVRNTTTGNLVTPLKVLAVDTGGKVQSFPLGATKSDANTTLMPPPNDAFMPWLQPVMSGSNIVGYNPILQINQPFATPQDPTNTSSIGNGKNNNWLQEATATTFNLIIAAGDTPARSTEDNGGIHNFTRFLEHWSATSSTIPARISGSFIQFKKSAYATASFTTSLVGASSDLLYKLNVNNGASSFYMPPIRQWGFDVGLLSQAPDLFAQRLVILPPDLPDEYFREVSRDDQWVQTLLCGKTNETGTPYAIDKDQRPSSCQS